MPTSVFPIQRSAVESSSDAILYHEAKNSVRRPKRSTYTKLLGQGRTAHFVKSPVAHWGQPIFGVKSYPIL